MINSIQGPNGLGGINSNNSNSDPALTPTAVSDYIWTQLLPQLQNTYNTVLAQLQTEYAFTDPQKYQQMVQALNMRYTQAANTLTNDYNLARATSDPQKLQSILNDATSAAASLDTPLTPEQQKAQDDYSDATSIANQITSEIQKLKSQISSISLIISDQKNTIIPQLQQKINELKNTDPTQAALLQKQLDQANTDLANLDAQESSLQDNENTLDNLSSQLSNQMTAMENNYQDILRGVDVDNNLSQLENELSALQNFQNSNQNTLHGITTQVSSQTTAATNIQNEAAQIAKELNFTPSLYTKNGQTIYFDMGGFQTALNSCMDYTKTPPQVDPTKLDSYLQSLFQELRVSGVNQIDLAFSQIGDIDALSGQGKGDIGGDVIMQLLQNFPGALEEFTKQAHAAGLRVDLSFGGENAAGVTICGDGETAKGQADKLIAFMDKYGIDDVDFDLEDSGATAFVSSNPASVAKDFFTELKGGLNAEGKTSTLTIEGSIHNWPQGYLKELFTDDQGNSIFNNLFDGLNLMLYGNQFYLDLKGDWGIESWLDIIGKDNAGKIHIGFQDGLNYADLKDNWAQEYPDEPCPWTVQPGSSSGSAAAQIYYQLEQKLKQDGYTTPIGEPFWWPNYDPNRYAPTTSGTSQFGMQVESDFWQQLQKLESGSQSGQKGFQNKPRDSEWRKKV